MTTIRDRVVDLASVPGGISCKEVMAVFGKNASGANALLCDMVSLGRIVRAKRSGVRIRWFSTAASRDAWLLEMQRGDNEFTIVPKRREAKPKKKPKPAAAKPERKTGLVDVHEHLPSLARKPGAKPLPLPGSEMERPLPVAGVRIDPKWMQRKGEVIYTDGTKRTICPSLSHDPRIQVGPDDDVPALFSSKRYGEYIEPASKWAKAAIGAMA